MNHTIVIFYNTDDAPQFVELTVLLLQHALLFVQNLSVGLPTSISVLAILAQKTLVFLSRASVHFEEAPSVCHYFAHFQCECLSLSLEILYEVSSLVTLLLGEVILVRVAVKEVHLFL